ncbi:hypothetical protein LEMLEM_LOCUS8876 [Lemmus lemmus]
MKEHSLKFSLSAHYCFVADILGVVIVPVKSVPEAAAFCGSDRGFWRACLSWVCYSVWICPGGFYQKASLITIP